MSILLLDFLLVGLAASAVLLGLVSTALFGLGVVLIVVYLLDRLYFVSQLFVLVPYLLSATGILANAIAGHGLYAATSRNQLPQSN